MEWTTGILHKSIKKLSTTSIHENIAILLMMNEHQKGGDDDSISIRVSVERARNERVALLKDKSTFVDRLKHSKDERGKWRQYQYKDSVIDDVP
jgi:hypothetical protein